MKLTKETAIILTYQLWKWMQDNGVVRKFNWPGFKKYGNMKYECPCCEYHYQLPIETFDFDACSDNCPLIFLWPDNKRGSLGAELAPCCQEGNPYAGFEGSLNINNRPKIVNKMVSAIEGEMKKLGIKNREVKVK